MIFERTIEHLYVRHRLDISTTDLAFAGLACASPRGPAGLATKVERSWIGAGGLVCLSVRSGFDALLSALAYADGDEIAVSAITHPDMIRIIHAHRLKAIPIDLDIATLAPRLEQLERAISARTRAVMVVHLFGGRVDIGPIVDRLAGRGILLIEDCAQTLRGAHDDGDRRSDVALFSFGTIKTATALGGALVRIADPDLEVRVRAIEGRWPTQPRRAFARRVAIAALLRLATVPWVFTVLAGIVGVGRGDLDTILSGSVRGFPVDTLEFFRRIRRRPSRPMLALLDRRLGAFDDTRLAKRAAIGEQLAAALAPPLEHPGRAALDRTHWLFPIATPDPTSLVTTLRAEGFDATHRSSGVGVVVAPAGRSDLEPRVSEQIMSSVVFVPAYPELPAAAVDRLAALLRG